MDLTQTLYFLFSTLAIMIPQFIVLIIGIVLSFMNLSKTPKASKMALIGLGLMLLATLLSVAVSVLQVQLSLWYRDSYTTIIYINTTVRFVLNIAWAAGLGTLIYAIWTERGER
jgi:phosphoglycerol transferase MdoB-like AlkP superfamily enzyme